MQDDMPVMNDGVKLSCHADYDHLQQDDTSMWHLLYISYREKYTHSRSCLHKLQL